MLGSCRVNNDPWCSMSMMTSDGLWRIRWRAGLGGLEWSRSCVTKWTTSTHSSYFSWPLKEKLFVNQMYDSTSMQSAGKYLVLNSASKSSLFFFFLPNFNLTLTSHQILSFHMIFLILISSDRKISFAIDSIYQVKITYMK